MNQLVEEKLKLLPDHPGVYRMFNAEGEIIYVGKAVNLRNRVRQYFQAPRRALLWPVTQRRNAKGRIKLHTRYIPRAALQKGYCQGHCPARAAVPYVSLKQMLRAVFGQRNAGGIP